MAINLRLESVAKQLGNAQRIIEDGIQKGNLSPIDRDLALDIIRRSYEQLTLNDGLTASAMVEQQVENPKNEISTVGTKDKVDADLLDYDTGNQVVEPDISVQEEIVVAKNLEEPTVTSPLKVEEKDIKEEPIGIEGSHQDTSTEEETATKQNDDTPQAEDDISPNGNGKSNDILGNRLKGAKTFRNETFSRKKDDVSSKLQNKPIEDLTKAIGINDKFLYTKELFNGNAGLYANTILELNSFTDINDALYYIQDNFNWDQDNEAANQLIDLVRRKLLRG